LLALHPKPGKTTAGQPESEGLTSQSSGKVGLVGSLLDAERLVTPSRKMVGKPGSTDLAERPTFLAIIAPKLKYTLTLKGAFQLGGKR
jgi:hypothetical protein